MKDAAVRLLRCLLCVALLFLAACFVIIGIAGGGKPFLPWSLAGASGLAGVFLWPRPSSSWRDDPPTKRQVEFATDLGLDIPRGVTKGQLSDMITAAKGR